MAILKKEYELSVWDETLGVKGQKEEIKRAIIGAHDMSYLGRATALKLSRKLNGTNTLTFQMPSKFFDSAAGEYIHNEFCDYIFNERKLKLKYNGEWFEFYVKNISENKNYKTIMYQYSCEDAFIDELSRNGYGITFDTELYNNVEEIGTFTEQILEDSIWQYDASKNWGDFTEYSEEKLFKIPKTMFTKISGYKLNYEVEGELTNPFSGEKRNLELGDDLSRERKYFWDNGAFDSGIALLENKSDNIPNDGYIYVPYSCLDFCYVNNTEDGNGFAATEEAQIETINGIKSYCLAPDSIDPTHLIQFIAIPDGAELLIDEAGLIVNKDFSYVMTVADWNANVNSSIWYDSETHKMKESLVANKVVCYDGYLDKISDVDITFGKKISITDRTEINISENIDQYVTVYNNKQEEYENMFSSEEWTKDDIDYRICSYEETRMIVPQLARNLVQNGTEMTDTSGWEVMKVLTDVGSISSSLSVRPIKKQQKEDGTTEEVAGGLLLSPHCEKLGEKEMKGDDSNPYRTFINFGIVGQEEEISKEQTYVLRLKGTTVQAEESKTEDGAKETTYKDVSESLQKDTPKIIIGEGGYDSEGDYTITEPIISITPEDDGTSYFIRPTVNIKNPYIALQFGKNSTDTIFYNLQELTFAKAYTKGIDFFEGGYYKYTGRDIFFDNDNAESGWKSLINCWGKIAKENQFLKETDIVEGDAYAYKRYFRQQIKANEETKDTFMLKSYLNNEVEKNGFNPIEITEDDYKVVTDYIDLNKCKHYNSSAAATEKDCNHSKSTNGLCMYQKYGYCPYQFQTQKHCRKIRTLNGEKSNRFNLTQELSKVFEIYPVYYIEHMDNGKIITDTITDEDGTKYEQMRKKVFYITEKGIENKLGFRYEKNLSNISRTFDSKEIVTKLYVEDVDSELSKTGLCSIKTAEDNPSKDSYIIDFSYYTMRGLLDEAATNADLYGIDDNDMGYLKKLGYYNGEYDRLSNLIINLQDESYTELEANIEVNLTGIETAQQELNKIKKNMSKYSSVKDNNKEGEEGGITASDTYNNYKTKYDEQKSILLGLIRDTFMTDGKCDELPIDGFAEINSTEDLLDKITAYGFKKFKEDYLDTFIYKDYGLMGQFTAEYTQIQEWKKERAKYLKDINRISLEFYQKYEPYLKEGTWSDSNYLSDNTYYFGAKEVAKQGAIPKITYNISVVDLSVLDSDYKVGVADTTYIEDIETFGINQKTGLPNRLKAIISGITYDLDVPTQNSLEIQNYTTQFEDLFQQVSATVQSLSFNENIYRRSSNFTATKNISGESLQGGLLNNQLTLLETEEKNISLDQTGQSGSDINNHANQYKLSGEGLFFSNNGGQTWNVGVTPKGINADYINVGSLDASKISIVDGNYLYFLWDKGGITAYRDPQSKESSSYFQDFARFNKYGLSLVENGKIKLRAGYSFKGNRNGDATSGNIDTEQTVGENIGFYLYNSKGNEIFATQTGSADNEEENAKETARIKLAGEIFVTDNSTSESITHGNTIEFSKQYKLKLEAVYQLSDEVGEVSWKTEFSNFNEVYNLVAKHLVEEEITSLNEEILVGEQAYTVSTQELITDSDEERYLLTSDGKLYKGPYQHYSTYISFSLDGKVVESGWSSYKRGKEEDSTEITWKEIDDETKNIYVQIGYNANTKTQIGNVSISSSAITFYAGTNNQFVKTQKTLYFPNNSSVLYGYEEYKIIQMAGTEDTGSGQIGLYINNKESSEKIEGEISTDDGTIVLTERLFCCAKKVDERAEEDEESSEESKKKEKKILYTKNIFTVLKSGDLYFGGEIQAEDEKNGGLNYPDVANLPSKIFINDAYMKISSEKLFIAFDKIRSISDPEMSLVNYIEGEIQAAGSMVAMHKHEIKTTKKVLEKNPGFSSSGYCYYGGLSLNGSIKENSVTWVQLQELFNNGCYSFGSNSDGKVIFKYRDKIEEVSTESSDIENTEDTENTETDSNTSVEAVLVENYYQTFTEIAGSGGGGYMLEDPVDTSPDEGTEEEE